MQKVILLLLLCVIALALCTWRNHPIQSPTSEDVELSPELVPFYLVTFSVPDIMQSKHQQACSNTCSSTMRKI